MFWFPIAIAFGCTIFKTKIQWKVFEEFEWIYFLKLNSYSRCSHWSQFGFVIIAVDKKQLSASVSQIALIEQFILILLANIDFFCAFNAAWVQGSVYKILNQKIKLSVYKVELCVYGTRVMKRES